jgi:hypothetical protein
MLTKGYWLILHIRIKRFRLWLPPMPFYILKELIWQAVEVMDLIGTFGSKKLRDIKKALTAAVIAIDSLGDGGRYDLVDIDVEDDDGDKVRILIKVR